MWRAVNAPDGMSRNESVAQRRRERRAREVTFLECVMNTLAEMQIIMKKVGKDVEELALKVDERSKHADE